MLTIKDIDELGVASRELTAATQEFESSKLKVNDSMQKMYDVMERIRLKSTEPTPAAELPG